MRNWIRSIKDGMSAPEALVVGSVTSAFVFLASTDSSWAQPSNQMSIGEAAGQVSGPIFRLAPTVILGFAALLTVMTLLKPARRWVKIVLGLVALPLYLAGIYANENMPMDDHRRVLLATAGVMLFVVMTMLATIARPKNGYSNA